METVTDIISLGSKIMWTVTAAMKLKKKTKKKHLFLGRKAMTNLDSILKSRDTHYFANKGLSSQSYSFFQ